MFRPRRIPVYPTAPDELAPRSGTLRAALAMRLIASIVLVIALVLIGLGTIGSINAAPGASAVQVIQVYTEGVFAAVIAIGIALAVYIGSRTFD